MQEIYLYSMYIDLGKTPVFGSWGYNIDKYYLIVIRHLKCHEGVKWFSYVQVETLYCACWVMRLCASPWGTLSRVRSHIVSLENP